MATILPVLVIKVHKTGKLSKERMSRRAVLYMLHRRGTDAGIETKIGCHTFRATGITDYLTNGGRIEVARRRWPVTRTRKPQADMTGEMMISASARLRGLGFDQLLTAVAECLT